MPRGPAWTSEEQALLGTMTDAALGEQLGRTSFAVEHQRRLRGIKPHTPPKGRKWKAKELKLLGTMSDAALAEKLGVTRKHVIETRQRHGVECHSVKNRPMKKNGG